MRKKNREENRQFTGNPEAGVRSGLENYGFGSATPVDIDTGGIFTSKKKLPVNNVCIFVGRCGQQVNLRAGGQVTRLQQEYQALRAQLKPNLHHVKHKTT